MNENSRKKREWIKTAAIVFLTVMLILTFFSQTIMNYSLPEVATQYVTSGTITAKIRGSGVVESGDPYNVIVDQAKTVASVEVRVGDTVQKGTVLAILEDSDSEEMKTAQEALEAAQKELEKAQDEYYKALLQDSIEASDIQAATGGLSPEAYRRQLTAYQSTIKALENAIKPLEEKVASLQREIDNFTAQESLEAGLDAAAKEKVTAAENAMTIAKGSLDYAQSKYKEALTISSGNAAGDKAKVEEARKNLEQAQLNYQEKKSAYDKAVYELNNREGSAIHANLANQKAVKNVELYSATKELEDKQKELDDTKKKKDELLGDITNVLALDAQLKLISEAEEKVAKAQKEVDDQRSKDIGATITAPISGTVTAINVKSGEKTPVGEGHPVVVMQPEGKGYTVSFSVTNEQARRLSVGDQAELVNSWRYDDVKVTLSNIKPDTNDPGQKKLITFNVEGEVAPGQTLNLSVGQKSANYELIVPNSSIREDNNGKFILIVESKSSPLGTRYTATRVDVEVLASDDTQSAVTGALYGYEFVITTSTKPVEAGKLVRLANN